MSKKHIIINIAVLNLLFILLIFSMKYVLNYQLTIKDIVIKYGEVLLIWLFIEIYPRVMIKIFKINSLLKNKEINFFLFLKTIFIVGIITFGVGLGTALLLIYIFILDNEIVNATQIINLYIPCLIGGVVVSILELFGNFSKMKQKSTNGEKNFSS